MRDTDQMRRLLPSVTTAAQAAAVSGLILLAGCGGVGQLHPAATPSSPAEASVSPASPSPSPTANAPTPATPDSLVVRSSASDGPVQVARFMLPESRIPGSGGAHCRNTSPTGGYDYGGCPVTRRLNDRFVSGMYSGNPICRCTSPWDSVSYGPATSSAQGWLVPVDLRFGSSTTTINVSVVATSDGWLLADDLTCSSGSSVYEQGPPRC
jgi:hypothetical protein